MALSRQKIRDLYRKRAGSYDLTANLYYLIGFREQHYRKRTIEALRFYDEFFFGFVYLSVGETD